MPLFFFTIIHLFRAIFRGFKDPEFRVLFWLVIMVLSSGTLFYHFVEKWSWLDSLYFCVTTLTAVGYGDLVPETSLGKIFTIIYILSGIGIIVGFVNAIAHHAKTKS